MRMQGFLFYLVTRPIGGIGKFLGATKCVELPVVKVAEKVVRDTQDINVDFILRFPMSRLPRENPRVSRVGLAGRTFNLLSELASGLATPGACLRFADLLEAGHHSSSSPSTQTHA